MAQKLVHLKYRQVAQATEQSPEICELSDLYALKNFGKLVSRVTRTNETQK